ncbi:hemicentin-1-like isoform X2 [Ruditapes philippinarum]|uniref:hemicentin-1-like isoform X2 n=1 Tax=Ruditapes philippinarum TaxID=129788 RepID=UPI00295C34D0|nr:hemicentin-1-like isoform X2 [Ruditapes philippinarum]
MCQQRDGSRVLKISSPALLRCFVIVLSLVSLVKGATWISRPQDQSVTVGRNVTFPCEVQDPNNNLTKVWNKGTTPIFINGVRSNVPDRYTLIGRNTLVIQNVELADDSFYTCSIFTFDNAQVKLTVLLPPGPPSITTNVSSNQFIENSVISFNCSSTGGKPAPTIEWLRNGQLINSAIYTPPAQERGTASSHIEVTLGRSDHSANYSCKVFNEANQDSPRIETRTLNVQYAPSIRFEPNYSPYRVKINSQFNLRCIVDSNPSFTSIEWYKDGEQLAVALPIYPINSVQKSHHGNYTCKARNFIQGKPYEASASVFVDVIYAPIITTQNLIIANISTQVSLNCQVDANPPASRITWRKLGNDPIEANGPNFQFTAAKRFDGNYSCTAFSRLEPSGLPAEDISSTGTTIVKIQYAPGQASINPISSILVGQTVELKCSVSDTGFPFPVYEWRKVGSPQILQSTNSQTYTIETASLSHNGDYTCLPKNLMGEGTPATIKVVVNSPPEFYESTPSETVFTIPITQSNIYLEHKVDGRPAPNVQWFKNGQPLAMLADMYTVESTSRSLDQYKYRVTTRVSFLGSERDQNRLQIDDLGNYTCRVMSADTGSPVEKSTFLSVQFPPEVIVSPRVAANIGETATLKCLAQANPPPVFYWFRQSQRITNSSNIMVYEQTTGGTATFEGYLQIKSTQQDDFGDYVCEVNNSWGQIRRTVTLSVTDKPEAPQNLQSTEKTWESVKLKWDPGFNGGYPQTFFIVVQSEHGAKTVEVYPNGVYTFNVTRLMPHTSYNFLVYGQNDLGRGTNSKAFTDTTNVLSFPALSEIPKFQVEEKKLEIHHELGQSYCLRVEISTDNRKKWTVVEPCVTAADGVVSLAQQGATDVNVSVCLVYRPEVCGDPVMAEINEPNTPDLTKTQVIIIGCVCATILTVLLIILVCIIFKRRRKNKNYTNDPHSPRTVQQGNGAIPSQKPRTYDNQDGLHFDNRNGYPVQYVSNPRDNYPMGDMSYDSQSYDKQYEFEMNRRNANISDPFYSEKQGDLSFNGGSPRTPTKDPQQFIGVPEEHTKEGGSFGSGNESGYSTPDKAKPKKVIYEVVV